MKSRLTYEMEMLRHLYQQIDKFTIDSPISTVITYTSQSAVCLRQLQDHLVDIDADDDLFDFLADCEQMVCKAVKQYLSTQYRN